MRAQLAQRNLDVAFELPAGQKLALIGANASGKSTLLAVLAGLLRPDAGQAQLDGQTLFDVGGGHARWVPPHERRIGLLAQEPLLFPRMTVLENVAFGPRSQGQPRAQAHSAARRWLAEVEASDLAGRKPGQLSGGQQQRVALARALATEPHLLLLDEPLSAIDVDIATAMRQTLRRVLAGRTAVIVTHQLLDAVLLCDQILVLDEGRVVEQGPTDVVLKRPRSAFAASISGVNMLRGTAVAGHGLRSATGAEVHGEADTPLRAGEQAVAIFRPEAVSVHRQEPTGSPRNRFHGRVTSIEPQAHLIRVRMDDLSADITAESVAGLDLSVGTEVVFAVKAAEVSLYHG
ncbi:MAG TPA: ABC transporter ATP-binding protein [Actinomycetota bacterium]|nr:ABC transporter ATP-binding protein [Actinomycetota bacterium]